MNRSVRLIARSAATLVAVVMVTGCDSSTAPTPPPDPVPFSVVDLRVGEGGPATIGTPATVHYTGWLYDPNQPENKGTQFDTSTGGSPIKLFVGFGAYIEGFKEALVGMRAGGLRRAIIPPSMAYGSTPSATIPANSTLVFEIEVLSIP